MLKPFLRITVLSAAFIPFTAKVAFSVPQARGSYDAVVPSSKTDKPVCYMQTTDGKTLDLSNMCINESRTTQLQQSQTTAQLCKTQIGCQDAFDPAQPPPDAVYMPSNPPN